MLQSKAANSQPHWRKDWSLHMMLGFLAFLTYVPLAFTLVNSFKDNRQFFENLWLPALPLHWENYATAAPRMLEAILNSFSYSIPTLVLVLAISTLTGYTFARFRFAGRNILFIAILILIMLPGILLIIPKFSLIVGLNWANTPQAVILPWVAGEIVFGTFLMRTFFETLPQEYFEAARLDGASEVTLILRIAVPLALPALGTLAVLNLLFTWNDLIWPLVVIFDNSRLPVSAGILAFGTQYTTDYGATFAAYVIASLPMVIIFSLFSRRFMQGLQGGLSL